MTRIITNKVSGSIQRIINSGWELRCILWLGVMSFPARYLSEVVMTKMNILGVHSHMARGLDAFSHDLSTIRGNLGI
jgi:hypothetical protein